MSIGCHIDDDNYIKNASKVLKSGGNLIQIFLTTVGDEKTRVIDKKKLVEFRKYLENNKMGCVAHSSYLHNLCKDFDEDSWWIKNIEREIKYCSVIGCKYFVLHFGKYLDKDISDAYNNMYSALLHIHNKTLMYENVIILLETPTGQGTQICYKLEDLAVFYKKISNSLNKSFRKRVKICLDTCHVFTAGYDIRSKMKVDKFLDMFDELVGIKYVKLIHLNDSKVPLGSLVDRHYNIGNGFIGYSALQYVFDYFVEKGVWIILETPGNGYKTEIRQLLGDIKV